MGRGEGAAGGAVHVCFCKGRGIHRWLREVMVSTGVTAVVVAVAAAEVAAAAAAAAAAAIAAAAAAPTHKLQQLTLALRFLTAFEVYTQIKHNIGSD